MKFKSIPALALSCFVVSVHATTLLYKNLDDLAAESEGIVVGTIARTESMYGFDKNIYTFVTIQGVEILKGQIKESGLTLRFEGGQVGNKILDTVGSPRFQTNERVVLFIKGNGRAIVPLVGWTQGVFRVVAGTVSSKPIVTDYEGNKLLGVSGKNLVKEHRFEAETLILDQGLAIQRSVQSEASPGTAEDGQPSGRSDQNSPTTGQPLSLDQFLSDIKARVVAVKAGPGNAFAVESADLPETTEQNYQAAPMPGAQGQGGAQNKSSAPTLPRHTPVEPDPNTW